MSHASARARTPGWFAACVAALAVGPARGQSPDVVIRGGADASGHNYQWIVENRSGQPIVWIEFPHFRADTFTPPRGWKFECTHLARLGAGRPEPGVCRAWVETPTMGIVPGSSARFYMRVARAGALRRFGRVRVRLADGTELSVAGVELPTAPSVGERYVLLAGLAVLPGVVGWVGYRSQKKRARRREGTEARRA